MDGTELEIAVRAAEAAVAHAQDVRAAHRKKTLKGNNQREADIQFALNRLKRVMAPIRSELARMQYDKPSIHAPEPWRSKRKVLTEASQAIQSERRKLWKMKERKKYGKRGTRR